MDVIASFRSALDAVPDAMLVTDEAGRVVLFNDNAERLFGYRRDEIVQQPVEVLVPDEERARHPAERAAYLARPVTRPMGAGLQLRGRRRDGSTFPAEISLSSLRTGTGLYVFAAVRDVTEHRHAEAKFRGLLESAPDAMVMVDVEGKVTMVNGQAERLLGWTRDELLGQPVELLVPDDARAQHPGQRARYFRNPTTRPMGAGVELQGRRKDGSTFPAEISLSAFDTEDGMVVSAAIRDVTARKEVEREAVAARAEAERANRAKSEFLSRMSHELRTPLNAILGFAQLLEYNDPRPEQSEHIEFILAGGRHLLGLIDEVLEISRIESGHLHLTVEAVPVADIVHETVELLLPLAHEHQVLVRVDRGPQGAAVRADRQRLKQVLMNLVANATKYNKPHGEVHLSWDRTPDGRVTIDVEDTGLGIRDEVIDRLFLPFERLDQIGSSIAGTGLGLALSRGLVEGMNGRIGVRSRHGEGSTFSIELDSATPDAASTSPAVAGTAPAAAHRPVVTRRVLYVDDNLSNLRLVENILRRRPDLELIPTLQGSMALELAVQDPPDLVLLDLNLPDIPGDEVLRRLQAHPATAAIPVVVVSADALAARRAQLLEQGAHGYVTKPIDIALFLETIEEALARAGAPTADTSS